MDVSFFNYQFTWAKSAWERGGWLSSWLRIERNDPFWTPPPYRLIKTALNPAGNPHLARLNPAYLSASAMSRRKGKALMGSPQGADQGLVFANNFAEGPVAAVIGLLDPRREDGAGYLGLLKCANDLETLERLLEKLTAQMPDMALTNWIGPTGLSHLGSGLLVDGWNEPPPMDTPNNAPYLPEIVAGVMEPIAASRLFMYDLSTPEQQPSKYRPVPDSLRLRALDPVELSRNLLPLLQAACQNSVGFVLPDEMEAEFLVDWLTFWPYSGWVAESEGMPSGFILVQPDYGDILRKVGGSRGLLGRVRLSLARRTAHPSRGRLVFGGVLPEIRGRGIGTQLWKQAVQFGRAQGWKSLSIGPLEEGSEGFAFLQRRGAVPRQAYRIYQYPLS